LRQAQRDERTRVGQTMPIELLPPGVTREMYAKAQARKARLQRTLKGCFLGISAVGLLVVAVAVYSLVLWR